MAVTLIVSGLVTTSIRIRSPDLTIFGVTVAEITGLALSTVKLRLTCSRLYSLSTAVNKTS